MKRNKILGAGLILLFTGLLLSLVSISGKHPILSALHFAQGFFMGLGIVFTIGGQIREKWDLNAA